MKKVAKYFSLFLIIGLSLLMFAGCASQDNTTASEDAEQAVGNFQRISMNELAEMEDSITRIEGETDGASGKEAANLANELNHIKVHLETLEDNVNNGYEENAVTEGNRVDLVSRIDEAKSKIDDLVAMLTNKAGADASSITDDASAPLENVKTKDGIEKFINNYTDTLDGIEADIKDGNVNKERAKTYLEDMDAHIAFVNQALDNLVGQNAITQEEKDSYSKDLTDLKDRVASAEKDLDS